jgi:hypothetical protein
MLAVPNRKMDALPPSEDLVFRGFICGKGIAAGSSVGFVHLFDMLITLRLVGLSFICLPGYLFIMKVLMLPLN